MSPFVKPHLRNLVVLLRLFTGTPVLADIPVFNPAVTPAPNAPAIVLGFVKLAVAALQSPVLTSVVVNVVAYVPAARIELFLLEGEAFLRI